MKSNFLKISQIIVCASLLLACSAKITSAAVHQSNDCQSADLYVVSLVRSVCSHLKHLTEWNHQFLYSSKPYKELVIDFGHCAKWFHDNVSSKLPSIRRNVAIEEHAPTTKEMHVIVEHIKEMMTSMYQMLKELEKEKDSFKFLKKMKDKKPVMDAKLSEILNKIVILQKNCKNQDLSDLYQEVVNMEKVIIALKENKNAESIIARRVLGTQFLK